MPTGAMRQRALLLGGAAILLVVLAVFAALVASTQSQARRDLERRFRDRAKVTAAVTEGLFSPTGSSIPPALTRPKVTRATLDRLARRSLSPYIVLRDGRGRVIAASHGAPAHATGPLPAELRTALRTRRPFVGSVIPGPTPASSVADFAVPFATFSGRRLEVGGTRVPALSRFVAGFLDQLPNAPHASAVVVDPAGRVVGSRDRGVKPVAMYGDAALLQAAKRASSGNVGHRYFAVESIRGSTWRVLIAAKKSDLYAEVNGSRRWVPWLMLVVLFLIGAVGVFALRRAAIAQAAVYRRSISRQAALEINDNVIQRLAVVRFALERGQDADTHEKLTEALEEAQRLVNQLLGEEGTDAGSLRRGGRAPTDVT